MPTLPSQRKEKKKKREEKKKSGDAIWGDSSRHK